MAMEWLLALLGLSSQWDKFFGSLDSMVNSLIIFGRLSFFRTHGNLGTWCG
jgi:hypothetical protein